MTDYADVTASEEFAYERWPSGEPYDWNGAAREHEHDQLDFHVDLGCGKLKRARIGVDHRAGEGVDLMVDLNGGWLPFADSSIESIVSHHCLEHIGDGFIALMDECYRVLKPDAIFRIIVPLFPSWSAVSDPDHRRYFMADDGRCTFDAFCGTPGETPQNCWLASFSVPYTTARFERLHLDYTAPAEPEDRWTWKDARELRVTLAAVK